MRITQHRRTATIVLCAAALVVAVARCTEAPPPTQIRAPDGVGHAKVTEAARERAQAARSQVAWAGEFHSRAVHDWIGLNSPGKRTSLAARCAAAWQVARKYAPQAVQWGVLTKELVDDLEAYAAQKGCRGPSGLHAFVPATAVGSRQLSIFATLRAQEEIPTGVYLNYQPALEAAYNYAMTPGEVDANSWAVVNQAAADGIPQADLQTVAGLASISVSSAYDWYSYEQSGGFTGGGDTGGSGGDGTIQPYSVFGAIPYCGKWCRVGFMDLGGAFWGALISGGNLGVAVYRGTVVSLIGAAVM